MKLSKKETARLESEAVTADEIAQFEREELADNEQTKKALRTATPSDFQIVDKGEPYPYAASFNGCEDLALFMRKADCERFIGTFAPSRKSALEKENEQLKALVEAVRKREFGTAVDIVLRLDGVIR